jgi:anaerobic selenocysteine-containing dehydrogenase
VTGLTLREAVAYALDEVTWDDLADDVAARLAAEEQHGAPGASTASQNL